MATHTRLPGWIRRRISERPVARWISWDSDRPREAEPESALRAMSPAATPHERDNVVYLFRRSA